MDAVDRALLTRIQTSFPLAVHPYRQLALETGISESEAWQRISSFRKQGVIRRLGGIFDSRRLGYTSTLCAAKVPPSKIPVLAELSQNITEVTHNYLRNHTYNMWFTIIACSQERLEEILAIFREKLDSNEVYSLPALKIFKIGVRFNLDETNDNFADDTDDEIKTRSQSMGKNSFGSRTIKVNPSVYQVTEEEKAIIRKLQGNLPLSRNPFSDLAQDLNIDEKEIIKHTQNLINQRVLRRLAAILVHRKAGFTSNAMGVWMVPEEQVEKTGTIMASYEEVSHCYQRPPLPDLPYNLFTMIHGQTDKECQEIMAKLSLATGITDYSMLYSKEELKKSSMRYFMEKER